MPFSTPSVLQSLSADGNAIAVATDLGEVHVYDLATGAPVDSRQLRSANLGHNGASANIRSAWPG